MKIGMFELDITPALGSIIPGSFKARLAEDVLDPLFVRSVVFRNETMGLAVASVDAVGITADVSQRVREMVCSRIPMQPEQVLVMATHTHGGGPVLTWGDYVVKNDSYLDFLVHKIADSVVLAWNKSEESELLLGKEILENACFIRDYRMKDGSFKTHGSSVVEEMLEPLTTIDPEVLVMAVRREGEYVGAVVNFATHPASVANTQITGDYISILCAELKRAYGPNFVTVFINGACGNINNSNRMDPPTCKRNHRVYVGTALAEKVVAAMDKAEPITDETLACEFGSIWVKLRKPTDEELLNAKHTLEGFGKELPAMEPGVKGYSEVFFARQKLLAAANPQVKREIQLQVFRVGPCYIFGTPIQMYVQFGKKIKAACYGPAFVSAFSNDYCGYVPTPDCFVPGIYSAKLAPTSCLEVNAGDKICHAAIAMYQKIR